MTLLSVANTLAPLLVGLPLFAAIVCVLTYSHCWRNIFNIVFAFIQLVLVLLMLCAMQQHGAGTVYYYLLGGWGAPLGINLKVDSLAIVMLLITAILVSLLSLYSTRYFAEPTLSARFWPLWWWLIAGLNAVFIAADAFNIYVALEIIGMTAVALVGFTGTRTALVAALRYALVSLLGSICYLLGVALLYRSYGTLDLALLAIAAQANPVTWASLSLISIGLLLKTALMPLHFWLPLAHASAPTPVSAILSALVVKGSFYLLLRFWLEVLSPAATVAAMNLLGMLGAVAIVWGCIAAFRTKRLKLLVAYSTVAQLGYLFLLFPLIAASDLPVDINHAIVAAIVYFVIAHALAKAAMFLSVGEVQSVYGHDVIEKLQGLVMKCPVVVFTFAIAGISLIGLPPSGGFIAKWLLLKSAIQHEQWWWVFVILGGGLLTTLYVVRVLNVAFSQATVHCAYKIETHNRIEVHKQSKSLAMYGFLLAILAIVLGFNAEWVLGLLEGHAETIVLSEEDTL